MKKLKFDFVGYFEPKETWFIFPMLMVSRCYDGLNIAAGFLCFGVFFEICKEEE